jgi:hypothetical protein
MKMVEFTRDFRPHRTGETRVVPDAVAERLIAAGDAVPRESVFDHVVQTGAPSPGRGTPYRTRKRGT